MSPRAARFLMCGMITAGPRADPLDLGLMGPAGQDIGAAVARPLPAPLTGPPGFHYYLIVLSLYGNPGPAGLRREALR